MKKTGVDTLASQPYWVVPKPRFTKHAGSMCTLHAKLLTFFLIRSGLCKTRDLNGTNMPMVQETMIGTDHEGEIFLKIELDSELAPAQCVIHFCGTKAGVWRYYLSHPDFCALEIYTLLKNAFGGDRIFYRNKKEIAFQCLKGLWRKIFKIKD